MCAHEREVCSVYVWVGDEKSVSSIFCLTGDDRQGNGPHPFKATLTNRSNKAEVKGIAGLIGSKHCGKKQPRQEKP